MKPIIKWQTHTTEATAKVLGIELSVKSNGKGKFESTVYCSGIRPEKDHTLDTLDDGKAWCEQTLQRWIDASFEPVSEPLAEQTASVITQPTDATERLMLVEKLEEYHHSLYERWYDNHKHPYDEGAMDAVEKAINIVKQHQSWRKMPSDEKPQDMQAYNLLLKNDSSEYPTLYSVGLSRQYASGHVWVSLVESEKYIDESKILAWQPMNMPSDEFFESLEQPPSEVQDETR